MTISVLVPTYRRVNDLRRCLSAIAAQTCPPMQIVVVARDEDSVTIEEVKRLNEKLPIDLVTVSRPGVVNALNAGLNSAKGEIVAITDDDAAPRPDWLERIERHFVNAENVGGVGGRDWLHMNEEPEPERTVVGEISWYGRIIGNHHLGIGPPRDVYVLKGVNMSFRATAITGMRFDENLRGEGAQVWLELGFCLELKKKGWKLIYDPAVAVDHYPSIRHDRDQRSRFDKLATENRAFNKYWAIRRNMHPFLSRTIALLWESTVGTRDEVGLIYFVRRITQGDPIASDRWRCSRAGRKAARLEMRTRYLDRGQQSADKRQQ